MFSPQNARLAVTAKTATELVGIVSRTHPVNTIVDTVHQQPAMMALLDSCVKVSNRRRYKLVTANVTAAFCV